MDLTELPGPSSLVDHILKKMPVRQAQSLGKGVHWGNILCLPAVPDSKQPGKAARLVAQPTVQPGAGENWLNSSTWGPEQALSGSIGSVGVQGRKFAGFSYAVQRAARTAPTSWFSLGFNSGEWTRQVVHCPTV
jgi:hypothetical protein